MNNIYQLPEYNEIAFSFRDIPREVDVLEEAARRFAEVPVKAFLEIGCGNSTHMEELTRRGYNFIGIDINDEMLTYSKEKARKRGAYAQFLKANLVDFQIDQTVDFAFVMLGSLFVKSSEELVSHFDAVARTLRPGGLYLLDWCVRFDNQDSSENFWEVEKNGVVVKVSFASRVLDRVEQLYEDTECLEVLKDGEVNKVEGTSVKRVIFSQEFLFFISARSDFKFLGWWNEWDLSTPLSGDGKINRPIILLRRT